MPFRVVFISDGVYEVDGEYNTRYNYYETVKGDSYDVWATRRKQAKVVF